MNAIQEKIDERMSEMPVGLAKDLLELCKKEADEKSRLYKVEIVRVKSIAYLERYGSGDDDISPGVKMVSDRQLVVAKCVPTACHCALTSLAIFPESWLKVKCPLVLDEYQGDDVVVVHSITKYYQ